MNIFASTMNKITRPEYSASGLLLSNLRDRSFHSPRDWH